MRKPMTKSAICDYIAKKNSITKADAERILGSLTDLPY